MTIQMHPLLRNNVVAQIELTTGPNARVQLRTEDQPDDCVADDVGILLVEFLLGANWSDQVDGALIFTSMPVMSLGLETGIAAHYRLKDEAGVLCTMQGSVTVTGGDGDMTVDATETDLDQPVWITGWKIIAPGA
jgi:hypothetical protein